MWRDYFLPSTLDEALMLLSTHAPHARVIAGGTDLIVEFDRGTRPACPLIDLTRIDDPALRRITLDADGWVHIGPLVTHNDIIASALCVTHALPLAQACREVGAPQIRNRATLAGNLVTASPANDTITPLMALGAVLTLRSARCERRIPLDAFYTGVRRTVMAADELLTDIAFPALPADTQGMYLKLGLRRAQAISVINATVIVTRRDAAQRHVTDARIALGAVAPVIVRATHAESVLRGGPLNVDQIAEAARVAVEAASPIDDVRADAAYRRDMVEVLVRRALTAIMTGRTRATWSEAPVQLSRPSTPTPDTEAWVNGQSRPVEGPAEHKTVLRWLREDCGLTGTKEGCAEGECGACTVIMDGRAVMSCLVPAPRARGARIETVEALSQDGVLHPLQQAFVDHGAVQCGYCTPGFIMSGAALMDELAQPSDAQIREAISGNLCRCTGYYSILRAFDAAIRVQPPHVDP
jgi:xanthine dehydrogenase iron-sulfur cluster and FAD-binding subunit A